MTNADLSLLRPDLFARGSASSVSSLNLVRVESRYGPANLDLAFANLAVPGTPGNHLEDQTRFAHLSHIGTDGSNPLDRILRYDSKVALEGEVMCAGYLDSPDVMRHFSSTTGSRAGRITGASLARRFRAMDVACGNHEKLGLMCVIDFPKDSGK